MFLLRPSLSACAIALTVAASACAAPRQIDQVATRLLPAVPAASKTTKTARPSESPAHETSLTGAGSNPFRLATAPTLGTAAPASTRPVGSLAVADDGPWRFDNAIGTPEWLTISGHVRARYGNLRNQFRAGLSGDADALSLRTSLRADMKFDSFEGAFEMLDSRLAYESDEDAPANTAIVNPFEILQAYAGYRDQDVFADGDEGFVLAGRHTMNVGSRRLIARNRFRNTINAFTGVNATYASADGSAFRAFFVLPVQRRPNDVDSLDDGDIVIDNETGDVRFWGLYGSTPELFAGLGGELYYYDLDESDSGDRETRNRDLHTTGVRLWRKPKPEALDFEVEMIYQFGESRASGSPTDTTNLDHSAYFGHGEIGYSFASDWNPRVIAQFDYASGDDDPGDGNNNRFDTLFGARRFELGPTGIFGFFARANLITPGLRLTVKPSDKFDGFVSTRLYYLASDTDAWVGTGIRDPAGNSGDYLGNLVEFRLRWHLFPKNITIETGVAHLFAGSFPADAPNGTTEDDSTFAYVQTILTF